MFFATFCFVVVVLFGRVVAKFGDDFELMFGPKIDEKSIQN